MKLYGILDANLNAHETLKLYDEGSTKWKRAKKSLELRQELGLDHLTNMEFKEYFDTHRDELKDRIHEIVQKKKLAK